MTKKKKKLGRFVWTRKFTFLYSVGEKWFESADAPFLSYYLVGTVRAVELGVCQVTTTRGVYREGGWGAKTDSIPFYPVY